MCDSNLLGVYPFVNMAIFTELKIGQKQKGRLWVYEKPILELIFLTITENSSVITNDIRDLRSIHNARNSCRDTAIWPQLYSSISLLSGSIVQPKNTYCCYLKVSGQAWESQKRISINTNQSNNQCLSPLFSTRLTIKSDSVFTNPIRKDGV